MLLVASIAGPATAPAAAQTQITSNPDCSLGSKLVFGFTFGVVNRHCLIVESTTASAGSQDEIYSSMASVKGSGNSYLTQFSNTRNAMKTAAWMKGEAAYAEAYQNGSSQTVARTEMGQAIDQYIATQQYNLITHWNSVVRGAVKNVNRTRANSNISNTFVNMDGQYAATGQVDTETFTLANGTDVTAYIADWNHYTAANRPSLTGSYKDVRVRSPDGTSLPTLRNVLSNSDTDSDYTFHEAWSYLNTAQSDLATEADTYSTNIYPALESGELNATEITSRNNKMFNMGLEAADGNNTYANSLAAYAAMGLEVPSLNGTGTMTIEYGGNTINGMLYTTGTPPNGTWLNGTTYDTANLSGVEYFVGTDGTERTLNGTFTITGITTKQGDPKSEVQTVVVKQRTINNSTLANELESMRLAIEESESRQADGGGAGGGLLGGGSNGTLLLIGALIIGAAALANSGSGNGGGRRRRR